jgi:hypothetical protein
MSVPPPVGKHRQFNSPPDWPMSPPAWPPVDSGQNVARVRAQKKLAVWAAAIFAGLIVGAVTPGLAGHVIALVVWAVAAGACVRPARSVTMSGARTWARVGVAAFAALAIFAGSYAVRSVFFPNYYGQCVNGLVQLGETNSDAPNPPACAHLSNPQMKRAYYQAGYEEGQQAGENLGGG